MIMSNSSNSIFIKNDTSSTSPTNIKPQSQNKIENTNQVKLFSVFI